MDVVVTLVERDFLYGAGVLYNSLQRWGFEGKYVIGVRSFDEFPQGLAEAIQAASSNVEFRVCANERHFTNAKPEILLEVLAENPETERLVYLDPDIVWQMPWNRLAGWIENGVLTAADVNHGFGANHPIRREWVEMLAKESIKAEHPAIAHYVNGGLLALKSTDRAFVELWADMINKFGDHDMALDGRGDIAEWRKAKRWAPMFTPDQDALNMALMAWSGDSQILGADAMGFIPGGAWLPHAIGRHKPWRRSFLKDALLGLGVREVDHAFWGNALEPVPVYPSSKVKRKQWAIRLASALSRFYARR